jgi:hypothetical protein
MQEVMDHMQMGVNIKEQEQLDAIFKITDREKGIEALALHYAVAFDEDVSEWMEQAAEEWDEEHEEVDEEDLDDFDFVMPEITEEMKEQQRINNARMLEGLY